MNFAEMRRRVKSTEVIARENPEAYRRRVALMATGGYLYFPIVALISTIVAAALGWVFFGWLEDIGTLAVVLLLVLLVFYIALMSSAIQVLRFSQERDGEYALSRREAEALFILVEILSRKLRVRFPRNVFLVNDFNAGIRHMPRLGILGWSRSELILGLPLMEALTLDQLRSVIAHEFGHQAAGHGRLMGWVHRTRIMWERLRRERPDAGVGDPIWSWFIAVYLPRFEAFSLLLCRGHEYEADGLAATNCTNTATAEALALTTILSELVQDEVITPFFQQSVSEELPPVDFFYRIRNRLRDPIPLANMEVRLHRALMTNTSFTDTHPCLRERLAALGIPLEHAGDVRKFAARLVESQSRPSAAEQLLGVRRDHYETMFGKILRAATTESWRARHGEAQRAAKRLEESEKMPTGKPPSREEQWRRVRDLALLNPESERTLYEEFLAAHPDYPEACYGVGQKLIENYDDRGIALLEKAMHLRQELRPSALEELSKYFYKLGRDARAEECVDQLEAYSQDVDRANAERARIPNFEDFEPHGLSPVELNELRDVVSRLRWITRAFVARRRLKYLDYVPYWTICLDVKLGFNEDSAQTYARILREMQEALPQRYQILILSWSRRKLKRKLELDSRFEFFTRDQK